MAASYIHVRRGSFYQIWIVEDLVPLIYLWLIEGYWWGREKGDQHGEGRSGFVVHMLSVNIGFNWKHWAPNWNTLLDGWEINTQTKYSHFFFWRSPRGGGGGRLLQRFWWHHQLAVKGLWQMHIAPLLGKLPLTNAKLQRIDKYRWQIKLTNTDEHFPFNIVTF